LNSKKLQSNKFLKIKDFHQKIIN